MKYGDTILNPKVLLDDGYVSLDGGEILWYGEPFFQSGTITGTFRHRDCRRFASAGTFVNSICSACYSIPRIDYKDELIQTLVIQAKLISRICQEINYLLNFGKPKNKSNVTNLESFC